MAIGVLRHSGTNQVVQGDQDNIFEAVFVDTDEVVWEFNNPANTIKAHAGTSLDAQSVLTLGPLLSGSFRQTTGGAFPSSVIWWTTPAMTHKIAALLITRNPNQTPATVTMIAYAIDGVTPLPGFTITDTITYAGVNETSRIRTVV